MTRIKMCGLKTAEALDAALDAGADYIGLVFFPKSPRNVDIAVATELARRAHGRAGVIALVVDPDEALLDEIMARLRPDGVQFHGQETPARLAAFRDVFQGEIWKALPVSTAQDVERATAYERVVDRLLFDARPADDDTRPGGNGRAFDWRLLAGLDLARPFVLSGGLDPGNVAEAVRVSRAPMVDVSSGIERAPGVKDPDRIRAFARAVRHASERSQT